MTDINEFWRGALATVPVEIEPEPLDVTTDFQRDVNGSDLFQASYGDASGLPDWRHPIHPVVESQPMDDYIAEREAAGLRNAGDFADLNGNSAVRSNPRSNPSPWRI